MCGICGKAGIVNNPESIIDERTIQRMVESLIRRGPDDSGIYLSNNNNLAAGVNAALGHRRLSIIDLSELARQPMANEDGSIWIVYNGEVYNFLELRQVLEKKGHRFKSHSDTEVIIHLYEEQGADCIKMLRGMFSIAIWDNKSGRLLLARDRLGKKPLFYAVRGNSIIFASEIKSLLEDNGIGRSVDMIAMNYYLTYGYIPAPNTIFHEIKKLMPAHLLIWEKGKVEIQRYWDIDFSHKLSLSEAEFSERIMELLKDSVKIRLISDVPLGVLLSGGIDSSAITAIMSLASGQKIKTFSIGFQEGSFNELKYARLVARHFETEHHELIVRPDALGVLPELITHFGEPFADSSAIPTYYLSKFSRQDVTVALSGDGGDEAFAGYDRYAANKIRNFLRPLSVLNPLIEILPESTNKKEFTKRLKRFSRALNFSKEKGYASFMDILGITYRESLYTDELKHRLGNSDTYDYILGAYASSGTNEFLDSTLYVDSVTYLPNDLLVKADTASMAVSLEVRSPFLDHKLVEFAAQVPVNLKLKGITGKYILRKALSGLLPKQILHRQKAGFGLPIGTWLKKDLKRYAYETLLDGAAIKRGYFKQGPVKDLLDEHASGRLDHGQRIWSLMVLEAWHKIFIDG